VFEQACACFEIITSRSISAQIIRHRSFCFQETSQRYCNPNEVLGSKIEDVCEFELRSQDFKNRQNSIAYDDTQMEEKYRSRIRDLYHQTLDLYDDMVLDGVAKEVARNILPMSSPTRIHMQGNIRNWLFYVGLRSVPGTQLEHRYISNCIGRELRSLMPDIIQAITEVAFEERSLGLKGWRYIDELKFA
jgi:thymidylate synthase (FAD)